MGPHRQQVISTFNEYVNKLRVDTKRCWLSLFKFSLQTQMPTVRGIDNTESVLREVFENRKLKTMHPLTESQYSPYGWTPLIDATVELIQRTMNRLPKKAKVLFAVHTDGQENSSKRWNQETLKQLIKQCEDQRGWTFVYLGEGAEAWGAGHDYGFSNNVRFSSSVRGQTMTKFAAATSNYAHNAPVGQSMQNDAFYTSANLNPDDIDPEELAKARVSSTADPKIGQ